MERAIQLKLKLKDIGQQGLALDIDETLAWTVGYWVEQMQAMFGNPEDLTIREMISKYRYTQNVPYWQTEEASRWIESLRHSNEVQERLPLIEGAESAVKEIHQIIPVVAYITTRPETVVKGTKKWLEQHQFPEADIIARPLSILHTDGNRWKANILEILYPEVLGIIDDNAGLVTHLSTAYKGIVYLYDNTDCSGDGIKVLAGQTWKDIVGHFKRS